MLEDAFLHPSLPILSWLLVASNANSNFYPNEDLFRYLLVVVYEVAGGNYFDKLHSEIFTTMGGFGGGKGGKGLNPESKQQPLIAQDVDAVKERLGEEQETLVKAIIVRARYGGMRGDVIMMNTFAKIWLDRFLSDSDLFNGKLQQEVQFCVPSELQSKAQKMNRFEKKGEDVTWIDTIYCVAKTLTASTGTGAGNGSDLNHHPTTMTLPINALAFKDYIIQGIDFHCSPVLERCGSPPGSESERVMRRAMWNYSSGIRFRLYLDGRPVKPEVDKALEDVWNLMKETAEGYMRAYIQSRIARGGETKCIVRLGEREEERGGRRNRRKKLIGRQEDK